MCVRYCGAGEFQKCFALRNASKLFFNFFLFDISTSKSSERNKKKHKSDVFQGKHSTKQALSIFCLYIFFTHIRWCAWGEGDEDERRKTKSNETTNKNIK